MWIILLHKSVKCDGVLRSYTNKVINFGQISIVSNSVSSNPPDDVRISSSVCKGCLLLYWPRPGWTGPAGCRISGDLRCWTLGRRLVSRVRLWQRRMVSCVVYENNCCGGEQVSMLLAVCVCVTVWLIDVCWFTKCVIRDQVNTLIV